MDLKTIKILERVRRKIQDKEDVEAFDWLVKKIRENEQESKQRKVD